MADRKSAIKRIRTSREQNDRNRMWRSRLRTVIKKVRAAESAEAAEAALGIAIPVIDRTASSGVIHRNAAARYKSRLTSYVRKLAAAA